MAYIKYFKVKKDSEIIYASLVESVRENGKVRQKQIAQLGRVIDQENGIFKSRERGTYKYTIEDGYSDVTIIHEVVIEKEKLILDFGDSYVLDQYIQSTNLYNVYCNVMPKYNDTLFSMLFYRILTDKKANYYAETWWDGNYARILFPGAKLQSQRVSEFLEILGDEEIQRVFFKEYLTVLYGNQKTTGILIDSTGLENASSMSITQINNHNGDISLEIRLIYVIDRRNGMPIYFRYCPGNIVDVTTLCTTVVELEQYGVSIDYAIVDACYFSKENIIELYKNKIHFITRLAPNRKIFKEVMGNELSGLLSSEYAIRYGERLVYIKMTKVDVYGYAGYAYLGIDMDSRNTQYKRAVFHAMDDKLSPEEIDECVSKLGIFMILSSDEMSTEEILPLYYTRQQIEQVFDIGKNNSDLLPLRVQKEETFRGHLMLTFMATAILQKLQRDIIAKRSKKSKVNPEGAFFRLRNQKCKVYEKNIVPQEPVKDVNEVYKILGITCPTVISRNDNCSVKLSREL